MKTDYIGSVDNEYTSEGPLETKVLFFVIGKDKLYIAMLVDKNGR